MQNRTSIAIKNAKISLVLFVILLVLSFISRSMFIKYLGAEILGLNTLLMNLVGFLNLAELGIVSAVASSLYSPLSNKNYKDVSEIVTIQGWLYQKIGYGIIIGAILLMLSFPWILRKSNVSLEYAYIIFIVLLSTALLNYFLTYSQVVLIADMKEYKVLLCTKLVITVKIISQIISLSLFTNSFFWWIGLEFFFNILSSFILYKIIREEYPWLSIKIKKGKILSKKHPEILKHTKQLFFHKIAGFILLQSTPIIIYSLVNLKKVTIYENYMMILIGLSTLINAVFATVQSGVGNMVAENDDTKFLSFFFQYYAFRFWLALILAITFYFTVNDFIEMWVGREFLLSKSETVALSTYLFLMLIRVIDVFLYVKQKFSDIYAPIIEAIINVSLCLILGHYFGITGIITGIIVSLLLVVYTWKPYFLFSSISNVYFFKYLKATGQYLLVGLILIFLLQRLSDLLIFSYNNIYVNWVIKSFSFLIICGLLNSILFSIVSKDFRSFLRRFLKFL